MLIRRLGYSCIIRGFWNALARRSRPGFWVVPRPSWLQVMDPKDVIVAAIQLQRDAGLMASNLTVLSQYVKSLHSSIGDFSPQDQINCLDSNCYHNDQATVLGSVYYVVALYICCRPCVGRLFYTSYYSGLPV